MEIDRPNGEERNKGTKRMDEVTEGMREQNYGTRPDEIKNEVLARITRQGKCGN